MSSISKKSKGFTIVELLIVIVIIGILAAITTVAYSGITGRVHNASLQSDLKNAAKKIEMMKLDSASNTYPTSFTTSNGLKASKNSYDLGRNNYYYCVNPVSNKFAIGVMSKSGTGYIYSSDGDMQTTTTVWGSSTCGKIGETWCSAGLTCTLGYDSSTNSWATWLQ